MKNIIYGLIDPFTDELRYIGKSTSGLQRPKEHWKPCNLKNNSHKTNWVCSVLRQNKKPEIIVLETFDNPNELFEAEQFWIAYYKGLGCRLTNLTIGGDGTIGYKHHPETLEKLKESALKRDKSIYQNPHNKKQHKIIDGVEYRNCKKCELDKPLNEFNKRTKNKNSKQIYCKSCNVVINEQWRKENPSPTLPQEDYNKTRLAGANAGGQATLDRLKDPAELAKFKVKMSKAIKGINIDTGEILRFSSALEAKQHGFQNSNIGQAIKFGKPYKKHIWIFDK